MLDQYTDFAFTKMEENERMNLEDDPIYEGEKQSFYHGRLIYKSGEQVDYYRLLERDWFVAKSNKGEDKPVLMKGWDWRENITDGHNMDRKVNGVIGLPDYLERDIIIYESENAREFTDASPRIIQGVQ